MKKCRACHVGHQIGANQCAKPEGRNLRIVDHAQMTGVTIEAADIPDLYAALVRANQERPVG